MDEGLHPLAAHSLPSFVTAPGATDVLMVVTALILLLSVVGFGIIFLRLHTLPERIAHSGKKLQFEIVAVLGLISLFTHMHIFWIVGLVLALIDLPDFGTPLNRIAGSAERIAGIPGGEGAAVQLPEPVSDAKQDTEVGNPSPVVNVGGERGEGLARSFAKVEVVPAQQKERVHA